MDVCKGIKYQYLTIFDKIESELLVFLLRALCTVMTTKNMGMGSMDLCFSFQQHTLDSNQQVLFQCLQIDMSYILHGLQRIALLVYLSTRT